MNKAAPDTRVHPIGPREFAVVGLLIVGLALVFFGAVVWLDDTPPGKSTVKKDSTTTVTKPADADQGGTTTTEVKSTDTTTPGKPAIRSEAVAATLFGLGALVFLCGVFFGRISEVTLPGGAGFKLSPVDQAIVVEKVADHARNEGLDPDPAKLRELYLATLRELEFKSATIPSAGSARWSGGQGTYPSGESGWGGQSGTSPGDDVIEEAVATAVSRVRSSGADA